MGTPLNQQKDHGEIDMQDNKTRPEQIRQSLWMIMALCLVMLLTSQVGTAADGGLYGPAAPPGSAFIRVFNAGDGDLDARVGNESIAGVGAWQASEFVFLPAGTHPLSAGSASQSVDLAANRYYTAVVGADGVRLVNDDNTGNKLKALLIVYNMTSSGALSLRTQDGKTVVVPDVAKGASGKREVNPAKVSLAVYNGDTKLADAPPVSLARGQAFSLFVVGDASAPRLVWAIN
jgi:alginate O-acetyltransferase complex protein AlgF